ncbi:hypothetical protein [Roseomonas chloroacetimidivorans]|uniref:hypothetical protein n=1 Tax=Roseomonas chloroacetimidivorans TaxID=1766656 RepID=UPI003C711B62
MSAALEHAEDPLEAARLAVAREFQERFQTEERRRRGAEPGDIDWPLVAALCLDPVEGWRLAQLLGAEEVAGFHDAGALDFWPGDPEPVVEFALADRAIFVGRHTGRTWDTRTKAWAQDPLQLLARLHGIRPGQAAWRIARAFGLTEVPRVR